MKVLIVGSGKVGTATGKGLLRFGHDVIFGDVEKRVIKDLLKAGFKATSDVGEATIHSEVCLVCVPTPNKGSTIDLTYVERSVKEIADALRRKTGYTLVVIRSTVPPGTSEGLVLDRLKEISQKIPGVDFGVCFNPEFLTEKHTSWTDDERYALDFERQPRVVIGELDRRSGNVLAELYRPMQVPIVRTNMRTAEMVKYACNCALASRVSFWNEIFYICEKSHVDSALVAEIASMDPRIGKYGTIHGKAFGGKCLPKDLHTFIDYAEKTGYDPTFLKAIERVNEKIKYDRGTRE